MSEIARETIREIPSYILDEKERKGIQKQNDELESKIAVEKARQRQPLDYEKVKAFLTYFARNNDLTTKKRTSFSTRSYTA